METYSLFSRTYGQLLSAAQSILLGVKGTLLDPIDLVHEAYIKLAPLEEWPLVSSFLRYTHDVMTKIAADALPRESDFVPELVA